MPGEKRMPGWWRKLVHVHIQDVDRQTQTDQVEQKDQSTQLFQQGSLKKVKMADKSTQVEASEFGADRVPEYSGWSTWD